MSPDISSKESNGKSPASNPDPFRSVIHIKKPVLELPRSNRASPGNIFQKKPVSPRSNSPSAIRYRHSKSNSLHDIEAAEHLKKDHSKAFKKAIWRKQQSRLKDSLENSPVKNCFIKEQNKDDDLVEVAIGASSNGIGGLRIPPICPIFIKKTKTHENMSQLHNPKTDYKEKYVVDSLPGIGHRNKNHIAQAFFPSKKTRV